MFWLHLPVWVLQRESSQDQPNEILKADKRVVVLQAKQIPHLEWCQKATTQEYNVGVAYHRVHTVKG